MKKISVSKTLSFPADAVTQTLVVYGGKGMGKTSFAGMFAERLSDVGSRFSIIDPVGVWWGLQFASNGKDAGLDVLILGGVHGDLPIDPTGGAVVADLVADEDVDVVIDISRRADGRMWSIGERTRFVTAYATRLYERQGERRRPRMQIIDEAGRFVPQMIPHGNPELSACVGAIERMVEEGRNVGIGVTLITQRSARMNKSVSELAECMVAFRTVGPRSVAAVTDWLGDHVDRARSNELVAKLRSLPRGDALVVSPGWLEFEAVVTMYPRRTFDSSATPTGTESKMRASRKSKPDLAKYRDRMAETVERAQAQDPKVLLARIKQLEADLAKKPMASPAKATMEKVFILDPKLVKRLETAVKTLSSVGSEMADCTSAITDVGAGVTNALASAATAIFNEKARRSGAGLGALLPPPTGKPVVKVTFAPGPGPVKATRAPRTDGSKLDKAAQSLLNALAARTLANVSSTNEQIAILAGYSPTSSSVDKGMSALSTAGYLVGTRDARTTNDNGIAASVVLALPMDMREVVALAVPHLEKAPRAFVEALLAMGGVEPTREELAKAAGYSPDSSSVDKALSRLRTLTMLEGRAEGPYRFGATLTGLVTKHGYA